MADTRIFRVVKRGYSGKEKFTYKTRTAVAAMFAHGGFSDSRRPDILRVEAIDPADIPWTDVTDEFRNKPEKPKCYYHPTYGAVLKPRARGPWYNNRCTCWSLYTDAHPDYPRHNPLCAQKGQDPEPCGCRILNRLLD